MWKDEITTTVGLLYTKWVILVIKILIHSIFQVNYWPNLLGYYNSSLEEWFYWKNGFDARRLDPSKSRCKMKKPDPTRAKNPSRLKIQAKGLSRETLL
jgi:hypothetical protein